MNWEGAAVALGGPVIGFIGGYFALRWRARSDLTQWRRDRLLQFCADVVAAGGELLFRQNSEVGERRYPMETVQRLAQAVACVLLLGGEDLDEPAFAYQDAVLDALNESLAPAGDPERQQQAQKTAVDCQAQFLWLAHNLLVDIPNPHPWWHVWSRSPEVHLKAPPPTTPKT